jgi:ubiquitin C-terminal hydrolase
MINISQIFKDCWKKETEFEDGEDIDYYNNINYDDHSLPLSYIEKNGYLIKRLIPKYQKVPGLYNFEGNCYLNSILQCIYYCQDLTNYFIKKENDIIKKGGKLSNAYLNLILRLNKKKTFNNAKNLLNALQEVSSYFFKRGGNDPKAALFYILENLHNELKEQKSDYNEEDICCEGIDQEEVFQRCKNNEEKNKSIINELFNWCLLTSNECKKCKNFHYMCEYQNNLLIELNKYNTKDQYVLLDDLIKFYFQDGEKHFVCNSEIFKVKFSKKMISPPQYLIIILNRSIIQFHIIYYEEIDLSEYCVKGTSAKYNFIGASLTNDYGNKKGTHAISRCITSEGSFIFNDSITIKYCNDINGYNPYILFYKKK